MLKQTTEYPVGADLLLGAESFLTDLSIEDEALITGGDRSNSNSRSRRRPRRRRPRRRRLRRSST
ncbi:MAG: hypothetical protein KME07_03450 [Pegethrix bostrychoides GSE-TBD4-15B]|jgi:hypothetical protein|uniref:Uncharacterized protein n=1 Tax=Pegethrix bostrychoides GSE-TBD4-15B TaxID=2839662 RepID=A0A951P7E4_9CYAN|nr:hypothetical protein [Pegethrix bostrychoides GSE-TBD4-15B]